MDDFFLSYSFIQRALIAGLLSGLACGMAGVFVVMLRISFVGVCISHAALAGALGSVFLGFAPLPGAIILSLCAAAAISPLAEKGSMSPDTATGVIFSVMLSASMLALGLLPGARSDGLGLIWGNILTVSAADVWLLLFVAVAVCAFVHFFFKEVQAVLCHKDAALACGIPARAIGQIMLLMLGLVVASGIKSVGGLLIYSLIITPAAAAYQLTYRLGRMFLLAAFFGVLSSWFGLWLAWLLSWPSGATIVLSATAILIMAVLFSPKRRSIKKNIP
ncbi:metal ABC transporter permease [Desulfovibrio sp. OttesenSCG-928-M14]|nr:metal ABC transporter permease [Desulfovibrio sp. OttesenSCG-928-M14]